MNPGHRLKTSLTQPRFIINFLLLVIFSTAWIRDLIYWFKTDAFSTTLNYWAYTDWLIDYSQGFIRRGLSGEIWRLFPVTLSRPVLVAVFSWILVLVMAFGFIRLVSRHLENLHPLTLFGLLFLPSLFFFYLHDHNAIARKEILGYVTLLIHLLIIEKSLPIKGNAGITEVNLKDYVGGLIPVALLLLPACILIHEGSFLLFVPLHGMITLTVLQLKGSRSFIRAALWTSLLYLPAVIAFGAVYLSGTPDYPTLRAMCERWLADGALRESTCVLPPEGFNGSTLPGSLIPMQWSVGLAFGITQFVISKNWPAWMIMLSTSGFSLWYLGRQIIYSMLRSYFQQAFSPQSARRFAGFFYRKYFFIPFLFSLPIYVTAYDYGRWFTVACVNFTFMIFSTNLLYHEYAQQNKGGEEVTIAADSPPHLDKCLVFIGVSVVICILALILLLPHYCLFSCEILRNPLEFFSHSFVPN